jgi:hypothetical protein
MAKLQISRDARVWMTLIALGVILLLARTDFLRGEPARLLSDVCNDGPNAVGMDLITQNYYEELLKEDRNPEWRGSAFFNSIIRRLTGQELARAEDPATWVSLAVVGGTLHHETGFLEHSLEPYAEVIHRDVLLKINRWGHRDTDDYDKEPEAGVFRIALIGSSNSMGQGVEFHESFEQIVEGRLNETLPSQGGYDRYEIINFSVPRYHLLERVYVARHIAPEFQPHMMLMENTLRDMRRTTYESLQRRVRERRDLGFEFVREIVRRAGVRAEDSDRRITQRLQRFAGELVVGSFEELAQVQRETGIVIAPIVLRLEVDGLHSTLVQLANIAENAGLPVLRIFNAYHGQRGADVNVSPTDYHPTALGHALLAVEIYENMLANPDIRGLLLPDRMAGQ